MNESKPLNLTPVLDCLVHRALEDTNYEKVFAEYCDDLVNMGLPLLRAFLGLKTLHPLVQSVDLVWRRGQSLEINPRAYAEPTLDAWLQSPLYWMITHQQPELYQDLRDEKVVQKFPLFQEFRDLGATGYLGLLTSFGDPDTAFQRQDGVLTSWLCDAPDGFSSEHIDALKQLQPYLGLVAKLSKHEHTARNVVSAYLGEDVGRRVLEGQIHLGDVEHIPAVIWYSDLRDSTAMAERMPIEAFLQAVNAYFECTAGAILTHGGEVLRFIGDAVLAVFPIKNHVPPKRAAEQALASSREAELRLASLNQARVQKKLEVLRFGVGLHVGEVLYGNIGVPSRIEFSVIGSAANEVCRLESLTKEVGVPVLVSRAFKDALGVECHSLGTYRVKGVGESMQVFAPPTVV